jgi:hypothetical protein
MTSLFVPGHIGMQTTLPTNIALRYSTDYQGGRCQQHASRCHRHLYQLSNINQTMNRRTKCGVDDIGDVTFRTYRLQHTVPIKGLAAGIVVTSRSLARLDKLDVVLRQAYSCSGCKIVSGWRCLHARYPSLV